MNKRALKGLLVKIVELRKDLIDLSKETYLLFRAFEKESEEFSNPEEIVADKQYEIKDYIKHLAAIEIMVNNIISNGTGQGRQKGSRSFRMGELEALIVSWARSYRRLTGQCPLRSVDGEDLYGHFVDHIFILAHAIDLHVTKVQVTEAINRIKRSPDCPPDLFSEEVQTQQEKYAHFVNQK